MKRWRWMVACAVLGVIDVNAVAGQDEGWRKLHEERGIVVSTREQPGKDLPSFRGQGEVKGNVLHVLAVILDDSRSKEWAKNADEAELLRTIDRHTQVVYSRSRQTWPIKDRDLVMRRTVEVLTPGEAFRVQLRCVGGEKPEIGSVIRIKDCETEFLLRKVDADTTQVDYRVRADPGGSNPAWAVRWASKNIPLETLSALRRQIVKTRGQYDAVIRTWSADGA